MLIKDGSLLYLHLLFIYKGDSAYPSEPWILTPLPNAAPGTPEYRFTLAHSKARSVVERLFGVLKATWRCLSRQRILMYEPTKAAEIITACAVLHNMRLRYNVPPTEDVAPEEPALAVENHEPLEGRARLAEGQRVRRAVIAEHFTV